MMEFQNSKMGAANNKYISSRELEQTEKATNSFSSSFLFFFFLFFFLPFFVFFIIFFFF